MLVVSRVFAILLCMDDHTKITISTYDRTVDYYVNRTLKLQPKSEIDKFMKMLPKGGRVLDAGCGPGRDSKTFSEHGFETIGIDLSSGMINKARKIAPKAEFKKMDLRKIDFPEDYFDGIWACASLLHLKRMDLPTALDHFKRILKRGGVVYILVKLKHDVDEQMVSIDRPRFFSFFSIEELKIYIERAGLKIEDIYTWNERQLSCEGRDDIDVISCISRKL